MKCLELDPNDDAEVFGGPVRTNTDYESDFLPGGFGGFRPRVRVVVLPLGGSEDTGSVFPGQRPHSFGNVFNILRSLLGARYVHTSEGHVVDNKEQTIFMFQAITGLLV